MQRWALWADLEAKKVSACAVQTIALEAQGLLARSDLSPETSALLHVAAASAYGRLTELRISPLSNGPRAFKHLAMAVELTPSRQAIAENYGRTVLGLTEEGWAIRKIIALRLGIDLSTEARRAIGLLAAHPDSVVSQLVRESLAKWLRDDELLAAAKTAVGTLRNERPKEVEWAVVAVEADKVKAEEARNRKEQLQAC